MPDTERFTLTRLVRVFGLLREISPTMPVQIAQSFVVVAMNEGKSVGELATIAGAKQSTMSRHLLDLGDRNRQGQEGFGLVTRGIDPTELRRTQYTLSPKGKVLLDTLTGVMNGGEA